MGHKQLTHSLLLLYENFQNYVIGYPKLTILKLTGGSGENDEILAFRLTKLLSSSEDNWMICHSMSKHVRCIKVTIILSSTCSDLD